MRSFNLWSERQNIEESYRAPTTPRLSQNDENETESTGSPRTPCSPRPMSDYSVPPLSPRSQSSGNLITSTTTKQMQVLPAVSPQNLSFLMSSTTLPPRPHSSPYHMSRYTFHPDPVSKIFQSAGEGHHEKNLPKPVSHAFSSQASRASQPSAYALFREHMRSSDAFDPSPLSPVLPPIGARAHPTPSSPGPRHTSVSPHHTPSRRLAALSLADSSSKEAALPSSHVRVHPPTTPNGRISPPRTPADSSRCLFDKCTPARGDAAARACPPLTEGRPRASMCSPATTPTRKHAFAPGAPAHPATLSSVRLARPNTSPAPQSPRAVSLVPYLRPQLPLPAPLPFSAGSPARQQLLPLTPAHPPTRTAAAPPCSPGRSSVPLPLFPSASLDAPVLPRAVTARATATTNSMCDADTSAMSSPLIVPLQPTTAPVLSPRGSPRTPSPTILARARLVPPTPRVTHTPHLHAVPPLPRTPRSVAAPRSAAHTPARGAVTPLRSAHTSPRRLNAFIALDELPPTALPLPLDQASRDSETSQYSSPISRAPTQPQGVCPATPRVPLTARRAIGPPPITVQRPANPALPSSTCMGPPSLPRARGSPTTSRPARSPSPSLSSFCGDSKPDYDANSFAVLPIPHSQSASSHPSSFLPPPTIPHSVSLSLSAPTRAASRCRTAPRDASEERSYTDTDTDTGIDTSTGTDVDLDARYRAGLGLDMDLYTLYGNMTDSPSSPILPRPNFSVFNDPAASASRSSRPVPRAPIARAHKTTDPPTAQPSHVSSGSQVLTAPQTLPYEASGCSSMGSLGSELAQLPPLLRKLQGRWVLYDAEEPWQEDVRYFDHGTVRTYDQHRCSDGEGADARVDMDGIGSLQDDLYAATVDVAEWVCECGARVPSVWMGGVGGVQRKLQEKRGLWLGEGPRERLQRSDYLINQRSLGEGAFGSVWLSRRESDGKVLAIKKLKPDHSVTLASLNRLAHALHTLQPRVAVNGRVLSALDVRVLREQRRRVGTCTCGRAGSHHAASTAATTADLNTDSTAPSLTPASMDDADVTGDIVLDRRRSLASLPVLPRPQLPSIAIDALSEFFTLPGEPAPLPVTARGHARTDSYGVRSDILPSDTSGEYAAGPCSTSSSADVLSHSPVKPHGPRRTSRPRVACGTPIVEAPPRKQPRHTRAIARAKERDADTCVSDVASDDHSHPTNAAAAHADSAGATTDDGSVIAESSTHEQNIPSHPYFTRSRARTHPRVGELVTSLALHTSTAPAPYIDAAVTVLPPRNATSTTSASSMTSDAPRATNTPTSVDADLQWLATDVRTGPAAEVALLHAMGDALAGHPVTPTTADLTCGDAPPRARATLGGGLHVRLRPNVSISADDSAEEKECADEDVPPVVCAPTLRQAAEAVRKTLQSTAPSQLLSTKGPLLSSLRTLAHPYLLRHHAVWVESDGSVYIATEACQGSLLELAAQAKTLQLFTEALVWRVLRHSALALTYLHRAGFVHRDIKPQNIFYRVVPIAANTASSAAVGASSLSSLDTLSTAAGTETVSSLPRSELRDASITSQAVRHRVLAASGCAIADDGVFVRIPVADCTPAVLQEKLRVFFEEEARLHNTCSSAAATPVRTPVPTAAHSHQDCVVMTPNDVRATPTYFSPASPIAPPVPLQHPLLLATQRVELVLGDLGSVAAMTRELAPGNSEEVDGNYLAPEVLNKQFVTIDMVADAINEDLVYRHKEALTLTDLQRLLAGYSREQREDAVVSVDRAVSRPVLSPTAARGHAAPVRTTNGSSISSTLTRSSAAVHVPNSLPRPRRVVSLSLTATGTKVPQPALPGDARGSVTMVSLEYDGADMDLPGDTTADTVDITDMEDSDLTQSVTRSGRRGTVAVAACAQGRSPRTIAAADLTFGSVASSDAPQPLQRQPSVPVDGSFTAQTPAADAIREGAFELTLSMIQRPSVTATLISQYGARITGTELLYGGPRSPSPSSVGSTTWVPTDTRNASPRARELSRPATPACQRGASGVSAGQGMLSPNNISFWSMMSEQADAVGTASPTSSPHTPCSPKSEAADRTSVLQVSAMQDSSYLKRLANERPRSPTTSKLGGARGETKARGGRSIVEEQLGDVLDFYRAKHQRELASRTQLSNTPPRNAVAPHPPSLLPTSLDDSDMSVFRGDLSTELIYAHDSEAPRARAMAMYNSPARASSVPLPTIPCSPGLPVLPRPVMRAPSPPYDSSRPIAAPNTPRERHASAATPTRDACPAVHSMPPAVIAQPLAGGSSLSPPSLLSRLSNAASPQGRNAASTAAQATSGALFRIGQGPWSDVFSLGMSLLALITGQLPARSNPIFKPLQQADRTWQDTPLPLARNTFTGQFRPRFTPSFPAALRPLLLRSQRALHGLPTDDAPGTTGVLSEVDMSLLSLGTAAASPQHQSRPCNTITAGVHNHTTVRSTAHVYQELKAGDASADTGVPDTTGVSVSRQLHHVLELMLEPNPQLRPGACVIAALCRTLANSD